MRRKVGVSAVKRKGLESAAYSKHGKQMESEKLTVISEALLTFKDTLMEFAVKYKKDINEDPEFRMHFHKMCLSMGVDPLASSKGFWSDILGVGDFYFELGVVVVQVCLETRASNGGLITIRELVERSQANYASTSRTQKIEEQDVMRSIEKMSVLGGGFRVIKIGSENFVLSTPLEISTDHETLISEAQMGHNQLTEELFVSKYGWSSERFMLGITPLMHEGIVWVDDFHGEKTFQLPTIFLGNSGM